MTFLDDVAKLCRRWGGSFEVLGRRFRDRLEFNGDGWDRCPFARGVSINWAEMKLVATSAKIRPNTLIHELGHIFAADVSPGRLPLGAEFNFLGWEIALAHRLGVYPQYDYDNQDYNIGEIPWDPEFINPPFVNWGDYEGEDKQQLISWLLDAAKSNKLLDRYGNPKSIR